MKKNMVLVKSKDFVQVTEPVKCTPAIGRRPHWKITGVVRGFFEITCSNGQTFLANQVFVNIDEVL